MAKAGEPFAGHAAAVAALRARIVQAELAAATVPGNGNVAEARDELMKTDVLLGALLAQWEASSQLSADYRNGLSQAVVDALDKIVTLENDKPE